jgi:hypothetical protein
LFFQPVNRDRTCLEAKCGKIKACMESKETNISIQPPRIMKALIAGFNTVTNHIGLILFPVLLDLLIWFGPRLKLDSLLSPVIENANRTLLAYNGADMQQIVESAKEAWTIIIDRLNLTSTLSTFPIGIPSLISGAGYKQTPLGSSLEFEISTFLMAILSFLMLAAIGILLGSLYLSAVSQSTQSAKTKMNLANTINQIVNSFGMILLMVVVAVSLLIPGLFIISIFALFSPVLSQIVLLIVSFVLLWLLIPLVFSPHGIFANQLNVIHSITTSIRLVRAFLPSTGLFLLLAILMAQGLDSLWLAAPDTSWLTLVGIIGHAFVYTSLIAASFVYYRQGLEWMEINLKQLNKSVNI